MHKKSNQIKDWETIFLELFIILCTNISVLAILYISCEKFRQSEHF